jgi:hypothetical protein
MAFPFDRGCSCGGQMNQNTTQNQCQPQCPTIYTECPPICTCSKQVLNQYHIVKQPHIHTYHTEVVHHHVQQDVYIPQYTCSEVHVNDQNMPTGGLFNR